MSTYSFMHSHAEVHQGRLRENAQKLHDNVTPGTGSIAVIKADAYGHGAVEAARTLGDLYAMFAVANVAEAEMLRKAGVREPLLVFGVPLPETSKAYNDLDLIAVVSAEEHFEWLEKGTRYHLKIDSGMGRLGFSWREMEGLYKKIKKASHLSCEGVMTHFATADEAESRLLIKQKHVLEDMMSLFGNEFPVHAANSAASLYHPETHGHYVRHGIALYGYDPVTSMPDGLKPVMVWKSRVVQCKSMMKGDSISYGGEWIAPENGYVAVIPTGYADGYRRNLSGKLPLFIGGEWYPQVGRVTMDYVMAWLGGKSYPPGTDVTVMGAEKNHAGIWAKHLETIPYEVCCGISDKVPRKWIP